MDVLVTGATGRIGANTVKHLLEIGHQVRALVRPGSDRAEKLRGMSVETVAVDLQDREGLAATVEGVEAIVHLGVKLRGPSNSMAARNAVVCSGATAKPLARSSATKETKTRTARGSCSSSLTRQPPQSVRQAWER